MNSMVSHRMIMDRGNDLPSCVLYSDEWVIVTDCRTESVVCAHYWWTIEISSLIRALKIICAVNLRVFNLDATYRLP